MQEATAATRAPSRKRAAEADLDTALPSTQLPNLDHLRDRGVLGKPQHQSLTPADTQRRSLRPTPPPAQHP
ncbi:hypothetical protein [Streptomyces sp. CB03238]|uniref:hypothetical protein n=1 Tax=Streptomyces sp. CB03238 TaxID=1907777 RepID=UPI000A118AB2|nr:hypothetical protein [Streptomyces sp. CB03238]ORT54217.1 hypothetical protein BKD26_36105 [Streptomyces sp. CB03238]